MTAPNGRPEGPARHDTVAAVVRQWQTVHPGLDTGPMEIIGRVNRCATKYDLRRFATKPSRVRPARCPAPHRPRADPR